MKTGTYIYIYTASNARCPIPQYYEPQKINGISNCVLFIPKKYQGVPNKLIKILY